MILSVPEIRESEQFTMAQEPIASIDLMERAAVNFVEQLRYLPGTEKVTQYLIFCGPGNNGGDGLAIARLLLSGKAVVHAVLCAGDSPGSPDFQLNLQKLRESGKDPKLKITSYRSIQDFDEIKITPETLMIDALFGIGLSRCVSDYYANVVNFVNDQACQTISVDMPSGLFSDEHTPANYPRIHADYTLTFQWPKLALLLPENSKSTGYPVIIDIQLQIPDTISAHIRNYFTTTDFVRPLLKKHDLFAHKGTNGHGLLIAGSENMPGAAVLASKSSLRGGIGKVTVHTPEAVTRIIPVTAPEAIISRDSHEQFFSGIDEEVFSSLNAIAIGCGIGTHKTTVTALKNLLDVVHSPIILDADALNILSENKTWLGFLPQDSILTPHFKEFERIAGKAENDFERIELVKNFAQKHEVIVILKGAYSIVALPDGRLFFNSTGNPGMATAGSGDVLTGLLLALLSNGYCPMHAALIGVFVHGLAGDIALETQSYESLIASDIFEHFGKAFIEIRNRSHEE